MKSTLILEALLIVWASSCRPVGDGRSQPSAAPSAEPAPAAEPQTRFVLRAGRERTDRNLLHAFMQGVFGDGKAEQIVVHRCKGAHADAKACIDSGTVAKIRVPVFYRELDAALAAIAPAAGLDAVTLADVKARVRYELSRTLGEERLMTPHAGEFLQRFFPADGAVLAALGLGDVVAGAASPQKLGGEPGMLCLGTEVKVKGKGVGEAILSCFNNNRVPRRQCSGSWNGSDFVFEVSSYINKVESSLHASGKIVWESGRQPAALPDMAAALAGAFGAACDGPYEKPRQSLIYKRGDFRHAAIEPGACKLEEEAALPSDRLSREVHCHTKSMQCKYVWDPNSRQVRRQRGAHPSESTDQQTGQQAFAAIDERDQDESVTASGFEDKAAAWLAKNCPGIQAANIR